MVCSAIALACWGCAADRPLHVKLGQEIRRPSRCAVVFFVDGFGQQQFDEALAEGRIPNIRRHILERGVRVDAAVSCIPSITYANSVTFLTGRYPGHHGIVANKWFEPSTGRFRNYCFIKTYQQVDGDYGGSPTIYEILNDRVTVSIQAAMRRGCTHTIDNWATSGINWFFNNITGVDCLVAQRFELIAELAPRWGQWPDLVWTYFPGTDEIGHRYGPHSEQYKKSVANVDSQIGRVCGLLQDIGVYDHTYLCLVSDHGMVGVERNNYLDIARLLHDRAGARVWSNGTDTPIAAQKLVRDYDYVLAVSGSRWAAVYPLPSALRENVGDVRRLVDALRRCEAAASGTNNVSPSALWHGRLARVSTAETAVSHGIGMGYSIRGGSAQATADMHGELPSWLAEAVAHPAVELVACSFSPGVVHLLTRDGYAVVTRSTESRQRYAVRQVTGREAIAVDELPGEQAGWGAAEDAPSDDRDWLRASAHGRYPDLVPQIVALFDSDRAGSIVFFAAEGWDFAADDPAGGHGSILAADMRVPMIFAGPGLPAGGSVPVARTCDLAPTLLGLLGTAADSTSGAPVDMDGIDLLTSLHPAAGD